MPYFVKKSWIAFTLLAAAFAAAHTGHPGQVELCRPKPDNKILHRHIDNYWYCKAPEVTKTAPFTTGKFSFCGTGTGKTYWV
jgi:hypothetical protein